MSPALAARREQNAIRSRQRVRRRRLIVIPLFLVLAVWLAGAAMASSSGPIQRGLLLLIAALLPIHLLFFQVGQINLIDRTRKWSPALAKLMALVALAASPMGLYPLGALAVILSLFSGGAAAPALAIGGLLLLSPIFVLLMIALAFILSGYKGG